MKYRRLHRNSTQLERWSSPEVQNHVRSVGQFVIIPLGSFEQHGPHAPLGTDTFICQEISQRLARRLNGVVVPPVWFGISEEHMDFSGTITIHSETFCNYVRDIILSLASGGFTKILVLNGHGSHDSYFPLIQTKVQENYAGELNLLLLSYWTALPPEDQEYFCSLEWGLHANAFETSLIWAILPNLIKRVKNISNFPDVSGLRLEDLDASLFRTLMKGSNGVWGDPDQASREKGQSLLESIELSLTTYVAKTWKLLKN